MEDQAELGGGEEDPSLGTRGREGNRMTIMWDPGIPKWNTRRDVQPPPPLSWSKALLLGVNV